MKMTFAVSDICCGVTFQVFSAVRVRIHIIAACRVDTAFVNKWFTLCYRGRFYILGYRKIIYTDYDHMAVDISCHRLEDGGCIKPTVTVYLRYQDVTKQQLKW